MLRLKISVEKKYHYDKNRISGIGWNEYSKSLEINRNYLEYYSNLFYKCNSTILQFILDHKLTSHDNILKPSKV